MQKIRHPTQSTSLPSSWVLPMNFPRISYTPLALMARIRPAQRIASASEARCRTRGAYAQLASKIHKSRIKSGLLDTPIGLGRRSRMLVRRPGLYKFPTPVADRPGDMAFAIAHQLRAHRSFEFAPPIAVCPATDRDPSSLQKLPNRISGTDFLYQPGALAKENDQRAKSPLCLPIAIKIPTYAYAPASCQGRVEINGRRPLPRSSGPTPLGVLSAPAVGREKRCSRKSSNRKR